MSAPKHFVVKLTPRERPLCEQVFGAKRGTGGGKKGELRGGKEGKRGGRDLPQQDRARFLPA